MTWPSPPVGNSPTCRAEVPVWVIYTPSNTVVQGIDVADNPTNVAITPNGNYLYVTLQGTNTVSIIATASNTVQGTVNGQFNCPVGVAIAQ